MRAGVLRSRVVWGSAVVILAAIVAGILLLFPSGRPTAELAVVERIGSRSSSERATVLASRSWGAGQLVLARYTRQSERRLALAFTSKGRGWRVNTYADRPAEITDVVVGSMLVARSPGGSGQPEWSAVVGELNDPRIARVEVGWDDGRKTSAPIREHAYVVVTRGTVRALDVRFLAPDGTEIANVPAER